MDDVNVEIAGFLYESGEILSKRDMQEIGAGHYELMADRGFDGGVEKLVRLKDFDAALAREAALREELAQAEITRASWQNGYDVRCQNIQLLTAERNDLQQRLTAAEQRNAPMRDALIKIIEMNRQQAKDQYGDAEKAESWSCIVIARAALKPTGSGASK